jgi:hypothetical protein
MTGDLAIDLAISLAGIALMVGVSFLIGAWRSAPVSEAAARERLAFDEPDFAPARFMVSRDGKAAAAISGAGDEAAFVFSVGDGLATRRLRCGAFKVRREGGEVVAELADPSKPKLRLIAGNSEEAADWAGGLGG